MRKGERHGNDRRQGQWFWRRSLIFICAVFSMTMLTYLVWYGNQGGELDHLIAEGCFWLLGAVTFVYVTGATAQDVISGARAVRGLPDEREYGRPEDAHGYGPHDRPLSGDGRIGQV